METALGGEKQKETEFLPAVDVVETNEAFVFVIDLPEMNLEDLEVLYSLGELTFIGHRHPKADYPDSCYRRRERSFGRFERSFTVDHLLDARRIESHCGNGTLTIVVPKMKLTCEEDGFMPPQNKPPSRFQTHRRAHIWKHVRL